MHISKIFSLLNLFKYLNTPLTNNMSTLTVGPITKTKYPRVIFDRRALLKVKIKSLAAESKIIRKEEQRNKYLREELHNHRVNNVRDEARCSQLAYGYIRGRTYKSIEEGACTSPNWTKVESMVNKYGFKSDPSVCNTDAMRDHSEFLNKFTTWRTEAAMTIDGNRHESMARKLARAREAKIAKTPDVDIVA